MTRQASVWPTSLSCFPVYISRMLSAYMPRLKAQLRTVNLFKPRACRPDLTSRHNRRCGAVLPRHIQQQSAASGRFYGNCCTPDTVTGTRHTHTNTRHTHTGLPDTDALLGTPRVSLRCERCLIVSIPAVLATRSDSIVMKPLPRTAARVSEKEGPSKIHSASQQ
jgi:hypothetical protein